MSKLDEVKEFIKDRKASLEQEIETYGRDPKEPEEHLALSIFSSQLSLLNELDLIVNPE